MRSWLFSFCFAFSRSIIVCTGCFVLSLPPSFQPVQKYRVVGCFLFGFVFFAFQLPRRMFWLFYFIIIFCPRVPRCFFFAATSIFSLWAVFVLFCFVLSLSRLSRVSYCSVVLFCVCTFHFFVQKPSALFVFVLS